MFRRTSLIWVGRGIFAVVVASLIIYLAASGLDKADKVASCVGAVVALLALALPYLLPQAKEDGVRGTAGRDVIVNGGQVIGLQNGSGGVMIVHPVPTSAHPEAEERPKGRVRTGGKSRRGG